MSSDLERMSRDNVDSGKKLPRTKAMVSGIMERLQLLLQVTILPEAPTGITRSTSSIVDAPRVGQFLSLFRVEYAFVIVCVDGVASDFKLWRQPLFIVIICCLSVKTTVVIVIICCLFCVVHSLLSLVPNVMVRSDTDVLKCGIQHQRSCPGAVEMWADDSIIDIFTSKRWNSVDFVYGIMFLVQ